MTLLGAAALTPRACASAAGVTGQDFEDELKESIESAGASFISYDSEMGRSSPPSMLDTGLEA